MIVQLSTSSSITQYY